MLKGQHFIAGSWIGSDNTFANAPVSGAEDHFAVGTVALVNQAAQAAEEAFTTFATTTRAVRAAFLRAIADEIDARGADLTKIGSRETGLPEARLEGERGRTVGQLRLFADHIEIGAYLDRRHDAGAPDRAPLPAPELFMLQRPVGPVAVFGASNFPLAFSVAGGDTASALAAGCPVVVKGHSAHPGTSDIVAQAIAAAIARTSMPPGVFSLIQGGNRAVGQALVQHPLIAAVGFTGSLGGGRALFDLCAARPDPIPFFGELGSVNPMFLLPGALAARGEEIAKGWAASLTMGAGQFCTNPGLAIVIDGPDGDAFAASAKAAVEEVAPQTMLTDGIASAYHSGSAAIDTHAATLALVVADPARRSASPGLYRTTGTAFLADHALGQEVFGPLGLIVTVATADEMASLAEGLEGQLTASLHLDASDTDLARGLLPVLERKAGRILVNGYPTGVEVADAMVHGGPYPASTNFGATSVGTLSIRRWLRPVCYQNLPKELLPADLAGT